MSAKEWVVANKIRAGAGAVVGIAATVMLIVNAVTWAQDERNDISTEISQQIEEEVLIQKGRVQASNTVHARAMAVQSAKHDYDFYEIRAEQAEEQLVQLEEDADAGVQLTASQQRKMRRLETQVTDFQSKQDEALEKLAAAEELNESKT